MMTFEGKDLKDSFQESFGFSVEELDAKQLLWLTKFSKHIRGRCRNNAAFNNYMNRNFSPAKFKEVPREWNGKTYMGLSIIVKDTEISDKEESDE